MKKRLLSLLMVVAMLLGIALPAATAAEKADEIPCKTYLQEETAFNGTAQEVRDAPAEDLSFFEGLGSVTWTASFKTSSTALMALMALNGNTNANNYISFYMNGGNTLGTEIRSYNGSTMEVNTLIKTNTLSGVNLADDQWHTVTLTISENQYYRFYVDQKLVLDSAASDTNFAKEMSWDITSFTMGGARRISGNSYLFSGSMKDVKAYNGALSETEILKDHGFAPPAQLPDPALSYEHAVIDGTSGSFVKADGDAFALKAMDKGSVSFQFKLNESAYKSTIAGLFSLSQKEQENNYGAFYLKPSAGQVGIEVRGGSSISAALPSGTSMTDGRWHTVTFVFDGTKANIYYDGLQAGAKDAAFAGLFSGASWGSAANAVTVGGIQRNSANTWAFNGTIADVKVFNEALSAEQVAVAQSATTGMSSYDQNTVKTPEYGIFDMGDDNSYNYRIPALVTLSDGTMIAAADQRNTHWNDYGNIDSAIRKSTDGGKTWSNITDVIDLKSQPYFSGSQSAFAIDPCLLVETQGEHKDRVWMLVDMFPESSGTGAAKTGSGFTKIDGKAYLNLYDASSNVYTVREEGKVYDKDGNVTDYTVKQNTVQPFHDYGDLYKAGSYVGNIYLRSQGSGNDTAPLTVFMSSYLLLTYSDDKGDSWSEPVNITGMVKEDWMRFYGVGPGTGLQLQNGTLMFPIYYTVGESGIGFQSSANVYSTDGGVTWQRGESPNDGRINNSGQHTSSQNPSGINELTESQIIQLNNGHLLQFMRNYGGGGKVAVARSTDNGLTWDDNVTYTDATEVYCQLSVVHYPELVNGKEIVILSNPGGSGRNNGTLRIGEVQADDTIKWVSSKVFCPGNYAYSCLSVMPNGNLGLLYEHSNTIKYTSFNLNYITDSVNLLSPTVSSVTKEVIHAEGNSDKMITAGDTIIFHVSLDQPVFVSGSPAFRFQIEGANRIAQYRSGGAGTRQVDFEYVVKAEDVGSMSFRPKIVSEGKNTVENAYGLPSSSLDNEMALGFVGPDPTVSDNDILPTAMTATAGSFQPSEGPDRVLDSDTSTLWHTKWSSSGGSTRDQHWIVFALKDTHSVNGLRYLPRQGGGINGIITKYRIDVSMDGTTWTQGVATGDWASTTAWKMVSFAPVNAKYVRLVSLESMTNEATPYTSAAEIRLMEASAVVEDTAPPSIPANVKAQAVTQTSADITWDASTDNVGVTGYEVYVNNTLKETVTQTSLHLDGLTAGTAYTVAVKALDAAGNRSELSSAVTFTTSDTPAAVDKSTLKLVLDLADVHVKNGDVDKLIPAAKEKFNAVLKAAQDVYASETATQAQADKAWKDLMLAIQGLGFVPGDKTELGKLIAAANALDLTIYEDGAEKNAFTAALTKAEEVLSDANALPSDVKDAHDKLDAAIKALKPRPTEGDKTELGKAIVTAESYDLTEYVSDANKTNFEKVLAEAKAFYASDDKATQGEIDQMRLDLITAMNKLRLRADKETLNDWLEKLKALDLTKYSAEDAAAVRAMIAQGEAMAAQDLGIDEAKLIEELTARMEALYTSIQPSEPDPGESSKPDSKPEEGSSSETPDEPENSSSTTGGSSSTGDGAKTGDSTPIAAVSLLAVAAAGAVLLFKKRRDS